MDDTHSQRTLAIAGVFQAAGLVRETARRGSAPAEATEASIGSIFATQPESVAAVFGGAEGVRWGLQLLRAQLKVEPGEERDTELARYVIGLTAVERKLARQRGALEALGEEIEAARRSLDHFGPSHPNLLARLGDLYTQHISALGPRIMVQGDRHLLSDSGNLARVRACLLAGLRAAVLWRQLGGRRRQLLLARGRYLATAGQVLDDLSPT